MNKYLHFTHNRMFWIVGNKSDNPIHNLRCPVLTYFLILHPTVRFSHKTYNFLLIVSLTEVLAVALGAWLVLVVLPPKRVQLLGNTSEKRVCQLWNIVKRKYHVHLYAFLQAGLSLSSSSPNVSAGGLLRFYIEWRSCRNICCEPFA